MSAKELADILKFKIPSVECLEVAATTLLQQAKRIEELEIELAKKTELERRKSELINSLIKNIVDACNDALRIASRD